MVSRAGVLLVLAAAVLVLSTVQPATGERGRPAISFCSIDGRMDRVQLRGCSLWVAQGRKPRHAADGHMPLPGTHAAHSDPLAVNTWLQQCRPLAVLAAADAAAADAPALHTSRLPYPTWDRDLTCCSSKDS